MVDGHSSRVHLQCAFRVLLSGQVLRIFSAREVLASASKGGLCIVAGVCILRFVEDP